MTDLPFHFVCNKEEEFNVMNKKTSFPFNIKSCLYSNYKQFSCPIKFNLIAKIIICLNYSKFSFYLHWIYKS